MCASVLYRKSSSLTVEVGADFSPPVAGCTALDFPAVDPPGTMVLGSPVVMTTSGLLAPTPPVLGTWISLTKGCVLLAVSEAPEKKKKRLLQGHRLYSKSCATFQKSFSGQWEPTLDRKMLNEWLEVPKNSVGGLPPPSIYKQALAGRAMQMTLLHASRYKIFNTLSTMRSPADLRLGLGVTMVTVEHVPIVAGETDLNLTVPGKGLNLAAVVTCFPFCLAVTSPPVALDFVTVSKDPLGLPATPCVLLLVWFPLEFEDPCDLATMTTLETGVAEGTATLTCDFGVVFVITDWALTLPEGLVVVIVL